MYVLAIDTTLLEVIDQKWWKPLAVMLGFCSAYRHEYIFCILCVFTKMDLIEAERIHGYTK